jgi:hypothetical protein
MKKIIITIAFIASVITAGLWAYKTGGVVSFEGKGWDLRISLWAFVTSLMSGAGLVWILIGLCFWILKSPMRVLSFLRKDSAKHNEADALLAIEFLDRDMLRQASKKFGKQPQLMNAYLKSKLALKICDYESLQMHLPVIEKESEALALFFRMSYEKNRKDYSLALRYGIELLKLDGPVVFTDLLMWAEVTGKVDLLKPYMEQAYAEKPSWFIFKNLIPVWNEKGKGGAVLSELQKLGKNEQRQEIFHELFLRKGISDPLQKISLTKKILHEVPLNNLGLLMLKDLYTQACLWDEVESINKELAI